MQSSAIFLALAGAGVGLGAYVLCALARHGWRRWGGPAALVAVYAALAALVFLGMGTPRPMTAVPVVGAILWGATLSDEEYAILWFGYDEGAAIYLLVRSKGGGPPLLVELPWNQQQAEGLYARMYGGGKDEGAPDLSTEDLPGQGGYDERKPLFYDQPSDPMPLKGGD